MQQGQRHKAALSHASNRAVDASFTALLDSWEGTLELTCREKLMAAGPLIANPLLDELSDKLMSGSVKNPSGWILSALKNAEDMGQWAHILDARSSDLLKKAGPSVANPLLEELNEKLERGEVENPRSWIMSALDKRLEGHRAAQGAKRPLGCK